nr:wiskott-Aldrich syndrome protein homolog 1-like [Aegilops tauschii subsp. strangulata]
MAVFKLSAWTTNPGAIPRTAELLLPADDAVEFDADPDRAERLALRLARFPVRIHLAECVDHRRPVPQPPPPAADDSGESNHNSPPVPPRWPQHHQFPPANPAPQPPKANGGRRRHRRRAFAPPTCRSWEGVLGAHPSAVAEANRVSALLRVGSNALGKAGPHPVPAPARDPMTFQNALAPCDSNRLTTLVARPIAAPAAHGPSAPLASDPTISESSILLEPRQVAVVEAGCPIVPPCVARAEPTLTAAAQCETSDEGPPTAVDRAPDNPPIADPAPNLPRALRHVIPRLRMHWWAC